MDEYLDLINDFKENNYSDDEIVKALSDDPFVKDLVDNNYDASETIQVLTTGKGFENRGALWSAGRGVVSGSADLLGIPADALNALLGHNRQNTTDEDVEYTRQRLRETRGQPRPSGTLYRPPSGEPSTSIYEYMGVEKPAGLPGGSQSLKDAANFAGEAVGLPENALAYNNINELHPDDRPWAIGGEILGQASIPGLGIAGRAAATPRLFSKPQAIANARGFMAGRPALPVDQNAIMRSARANPRRFARNEVAAAGGAATLGGLAVASDPDNIPLRVAAEIAGGVAGPIGLGVRHGPRALEGAKEALSSVSRPGREQNAADALATAFETLGESRSVAADAIMRNRDPGLTLSPSELTDSPAIAAIERKLRQNSAEFSSTMQRGTDDSLMALRTQADNLAKSGNPQDIKIAVQNKHEYFTKLIKGRLDMAEAKVAEASDALLAGGGDKRSLSNTVGRAVEDAHNDLLDVERLEWDKIDKGLYSSPIPIEDGKGLRYAREEFRLSTGQSEKPPKFIRDELKIFDKQATTPTTGQLLIFRNRALDMQRELRAQKKWSRARHYGLFADGALAELDNTLETGIRLSNQASILRPGIKIEGSITPEQARPFIQARELTKSRNDLFSRTFAGDTMEVGTSGALRMHPDLILEQAWVGGGTKGSLQMNQIEAAVEGAGRSVADEQEQFIRTIAANQGVTKEKGIYKISSSALTKFVKNNPDQMKRFPAIAKSLESAAATNDLMEVVRKSTTARARALNQVEAFKKVMGVENPAFAINSIITGRNPTREYIHLANVAKRSGEAATAGLRAATIESAMTRAIGDTPDTLDWGKFRNYLENPYPTGTQSPLDLMIKNEVISQGDAARLQGLLKRSADIDAARRSGSNIDELISNPSGLYDFVVRVAGSKAATQGPVGSIVGGNMGHSLIVAQAGSRAFRNVFEKLPMESTSKVLREAFQDPAFFAALLRKPVNIKQAKEASGQLNGYLYAAGITTFADYMETKDSLETGTPAEDTSSPSSFLDASTPEFNPEVDLESLTNLTEAPAEDTGFPRADIPRFDFQVGPDGTIISEER